MIRPDSGNPVDILTGDPNAEKDTPAYKGVIELLWDVFGGTTNEKGYKELDSHIGAIYGDSITYERANEICQRLEAKGFASGNVVFGIGSFTYRYVTRDTFGFAMKATAVTINGKERAIYKKPVTDSGEKTSARGRMVVKASIPVGDDSSSDNVTFELVDNLTKAEQDAYGEDDWMQTVWENGNWGITTTFDQIRRRVRGELS